MALETGTYISDLVATNPLGSDPRSAGDDHLRLLKSILKTTFPNANGAINPTPAEFNYLVGVTSGIQAQINGLNSAKASIGGGTPMLFFQATAPTYWTQVTTHNNKALRVMSGIGGGSGGSVAFTTAFASQAVAGTVGGTALTKAQIPPHTHTGGVDLQQYLGDIAANLRWIATSSSSLTGDGQSGGLGSGGVAATHTHSFTGTAINLAVQYIDLIICTRD